FIGVVTERLKFGMERSFSAFSAFSAVLCVPLREHIFSRREPQRNAEERRGTQRLDIVSDGALEVGTVVSTEGELLAVLHDDTVFTVEPRLHFLDLVDLHNRRAVDASKLTRVELLFQTTDRFAQQVSLLIVVDTYVISF